MALSVQHREVLESVARKFDRNENRRAFDQFKQIPKGVANGVYYQVWIFDGKQKRGPKFGELAFHGKERRLELSNYEKAGIIRDYIAAKSPQQSPDPDVEFLKDVAVGALCLGWLGARVLGEVLRDSPLLKSADKSMGRLFNDRFGQPQ